MTDPHFPSSAATEHAPQHDHRVYFMCECCAEDNPENGVSDRADIAVMPDGTWLCDNCYSDCEKTAYGMVPCDVDDFEFPRFADLPRPAPYAEQSSAPAQPEKLPEFEDGRVQTVYELLCDNKEPPNPEEHWEGWLARRIVAALARPQCSAETSGQED